MTSDGTTGFQVKAHKENLKKLIGQVICDSQLCKVWVCYSQSGEINLLAVDIPGAHADVPDCITQSLAEHDNQYSQNILNHPPEH